MAVPVAVGPQEREAEEPPKSWRVAKESCSSHALKTTGQYVFCQACGAYTSGKHTSALLASCVGSGRTRTPLAALLCTMDAKDSCAMDATQSQALSLGVCTVG